jgi:hypothetical protein
MAQRGKNVEDNADKLVRKVALKIDATVVLATPVDTGRARSNWQVELNKPAVGTVEAMEAGAAINKGKDVISRYEGGTPGASINITNNLPYIGRLNEGHSAQAPAGFVEEAVLVGISQVKGAKLLSRTGKTED